MNRFESMEKKKKLNLTYLQAKSVLWDKEHITVRKNGAIYYLREFNNTIVVTDWTGKEQDLILTGDYFDFNS